MKNLVPSLAIAAAFVLCNSAAQADDRDRVTQVDRYSDADVVHYDHHHRTVYVDEYGRVIGSRTKHHDHHYVKPRYSQPHCDSYRDDSRRGGFRFFFGR